MSLHSLTNLTAKQRNLDCLAGYDGDLVDIITELQGLKVNLVAGANANTNIAISGIATEDTLVAVWEIAVSTGNLTNTVTNRLSTTSVTSAGNIQCTQSTAGSLLMVVWFNKS